MLEIQDGEALLPLHSPSGRRSIGSLEDLRREGGQVDKAKRAAELELSFIGANIICIYTSGFYGFLVGTNHLNFLSYLV